MSTRYVWKKTTFELARGADARTVDIVGTGTRSKDNYLASQYIINSDGTFSVDQSYDYYRMSSTSSEIATYPYMFPSEDINYKSPILYKRPQHEETLYWVNERDSSAGKNFVGCSTSPRLTLDDTVPMETYTIKKGTQASDVSGTSKSTYPTDGVRGSYWYTYQGRDNIDPSACSIPATINGGTAITITVTPGTGKVYGGTVSYQYQVNLAGAGWTTIATTSATTRSYTVPYGTASIQVRVRAQDNIGFTSSTYVTSSSVTVINNQPPTAPGSIDVTGVVAGQQATITLTAATDPDGTIASYIYERSVDGSAWQQIANVNSLTQTDTISADWGTVAYRACAVDDDGASGPYVTSSTTVVNSGWVIISGPAADMGSQPKPFNFTITPSISGTTTSDQITVDVTLDGNSIYNEAVAPGTEIELEIDTRLMRTGDHAISVSATCASFQPAANEYSFSVPVITIPDGGRMDQLEGPDGQVIFPITLARAVAGLENYSVESKVHPGAYTGSGTYGSGNPNSLTLEFEPKMVIVQGTGGRMAVMIKPSGVGISIGASDSTTLNVTWDGESVSWYNAVNAANQMNTNNETYSYTAFG